MKKAIYMNPVKGIRPVVFLNCFKYTVEMCPLFEENEKVLQKKNEIPVKRKNV